MKIPISATILLGLSLLAADPAAAAMRVGSVDFHTCQLGDAASIAAHCASLSVPLYRDRPDGEQIELAIAWLPSRARKPQPDPVVLLAGGPGQSALEVYPRVAGVFELLRSQRAVLLVDQRGTGKSAKLSCELPTLEDPFGADSTPEAMAEPTAECVTKLPIDPAPFTTEDAVADLDAVRAALAIEQLNLIGGSYGTRFGQRYAKRHPERVRTLVLDSVVPESLVLGSEHGRNLDAALHAQFQRCRDNPGCAERFGDPAELLAQLRNRDPESVPEQSVIHPRTMEQRQARFSNDVLAAAVRLQSYAPETVALLPLGLAEAVDGRPQSLIGQAWLMGDDLSESISFGLQLSVSCAEDVPRLTPDAREAEAATLLGSTMIDTLRAQCEVWPTASAPADSAEPLNVDLPVLLISGELDPVTPPRYASEVAKHLPNARELVAPGQGHIAQTRGCMPKLIEQFVESADLNSIDDECLQNLHPAPFFLNYNGPQP